MPEEFEDEDKKLEGEATEEETQSEAPEEELIDDVEPEESDEWFDGNDSEGDAGEKEAEASETAAAPEAGEEEAGETAEDPQPVEETAEIEPEPQRDASVQQETPAPQQAPDGEQPSAEQRQQEMQAWYQNTTKALAEQVYAVDEETRDLLDSEPSKVLPQLAANLHMQVLSAAVTQVAQMVPSLVGQYNSQAEQYHAAETEFYESYPELAGHENDVLEVAQLYRSTHPDVDAAKAKEDIAALAMMRLKITPQQMRQAVEEAPQVVSAPPRPGSARPAAPPRGQQQLSPDDLLFEEMKEDGY